MFEMHDKYYGKNIQAMWCVYLTAPVIADHGWNSAPGLWELLMYLWISDVPSDMKNVGI